MHVAAHVQTHCLGTADHRAATAHTTLLPGHDASSTHSAHVSHAPVDSFSNEYRYVVGVGCVHIRSRCWAWRLDQYL